jgi:hypothetical protein
VNRDAKSAIHVAIINVDDNMMIKTTHDDAQMQFFIGFSDMDDTQQDHDVTTIYYKIWAINTGNKMLNSPFLKKQAMSK